MPLLLTPTHPCLSLSLNLSLCRGNGEFKSVTLSPQHSASLSVSRRWVEVFLPGAALVFESFTLLHWIRPHVSMSPRVACCAVIVDQGCIIIFLNNYLGLLIKTRAAGNGRLNALGVPIVLVNLALVVAVIVTSWFATQQSVENSWAEDNSLSVARSMITTEHSLGNATREKQCNEASLQSFEPAHLSPDSGSEGGGGSGGVSPATPGPVPPIVARLEWCGCSLGVGPRDRNAQGAPSLDPSNSADCTSGQDPSREGQAKDVDAV